MFISSRIKLFPTMDKNLIIIRSLEQHKQQQNQHLLNTNPMDFIINLIYKLNEYNWSQNRFFRISSSVTLYENNLASKLGIFASIFCS